MLNPKNYPFYQKVKRNLYMMEKLLTDETNNPDFDRDTIQNNEQNDHKVDKNGRSKSADGQVDTQANTKI